MSDPSAVANPALPELDVVKLPGASKRLRWFEVSLILVISFGGPLINAIYILHFGPAAAPHSSNARWLAATVQEAACLLLLGYILRRRGLGFKDLGFRWSIRDFGVGLLVAVASVVSYAIGYSLFNSLHLATFGPTGARSASVFFSHPGAMFILFSLLNPFFEELIVRAYLMTEVAELTGSTTLAVFLSVAVQSSYHLYYGWLGALALACMFLVFSLYYARWRQALPIIVAHGFFDINSLIRLW